MRMQESSVRKTERSFTKYQLPLFLFLAYLLSWWSVPFANGGIIPHGPPIAAVIVITLAMGRQGLEKFWQRLTHWRAGRWYLIGPGIIAAYLCTAFAINLLLGATVTNPLRIPSTVVLIQLLLLGGLWEEPGWSGYALPTLQERFANRKNGPLIATLIVGLFRSIWHLPLFLYGTLPWYDIFIFVIAFQILISWLYNRTKGSVPAVMLFHFASNVLTGSMMLLAFSGSEKTSYYLLFVACASLAAFVVAWRSQFRLGWEGLESS